MGLFLMYSMKDSVTSTEICSDRDKKTKRARQAKKTTTPDSCKCVLCVCTHILHVVKTERGSLAGVFQRLRGKSLVVTMQEAEERKHMRGVRDRQSFYSGRRFIPRLNQLQLTGQILDC